MTDAFSTGEHPLSAPDISVSVRETFGIDVDWSVPAFSEGSDHVPTIDESYRFDRNTTLGGAGRVRP